MSRRKKSVFDGLDMGAGKRSRKSRRKSAFSSLGDFGKRSKGRKRRGMADRLAKSYRSNRKAESGLGLRLDRAEEVFTRKGRNRQWRGMQGQAAAAFFQRLTKTERIEERERVMEELERDPKALAEEARLERQAGNTRTWARIAAEVIRGLLKG